VSNTEFLAYRLSIYLEHAVSLEHVSESMITNIDYDLETLRGKIDMNPSEAALTALKELESVFKTMKSTT